jgi:ribosomal protein S18 acetylase RimI-like enzyme
MQTTAVIRNTQSTCPVYQDGQELSGDSGLIRNRAPRAGHSAWTTSGLDTDMIDFEKRIAIKDDSLDVKQEYITAEEYIDFLKRTDLGKQYPKEDFHNRINTLVKNIQISLVVRDKQDQIIGICFGLTDFAYWLFLTDLGIDRSYERKGIGKMLMETAHELAGGEKRIIQFAYTNKNAISFYKKAGMKVSKEMMEKSKIEWTEFDVGKDIG